jgi:protein gp37
VGDQSKIEWTDATWNPLYGCTKVSTACYACYIDRSFPYRTQGLKFDKKGHIPIRLMPERLMQPLKWTKPLRIFVNSLSDLFHEDVPDDFIDKVFAVMALTPQHTYQLLTKRPERMRAYMGSFGDGTPAARVASEVKRLSGREFVSVHWPLPNVILGVTAEDQRNWDKRWPVLRATPAAKRMVSIEPLMGPVDLYLADYQKVALSLPDWIIVGGESANMATPFGQARALVERCWCGPATRVAPHTLCDGTGWMPKESAVLAVRSLRDQCVAAGVAFHFKQWGGPRPKSGGRLLDGRTWDEFPAMAS